MILQTILLIEDNTDFLENLTEYLEPEGYHIVFADNGKSGVKLAQGCIPDLIICDMRMSEMDGLEVLRLLRNCAITRNIPFIFSTAVSDKKEQAEALQSGADAIITKPFALETLLRLVKQCLNADHKRQAAGM